MAGTFNPNDMELTPQRVYFQPYGATAFLDMGGTLSNVKVMVKTSKAPIKADQTGETPLDKRVSGHEYMVDTEFAQTRDFQLASYIFPNAVLTGMAPYSGMAPSAALHFVNAVGNSDLLRAGKLKLHPQDLPDTNIQYDMVFDLAVPTEASEIDHGPTKQSTWKCSFTIYPNAAVTGTWGTAYHFFVYGNVAY